MIKIFTLIFVFFSFLFTSYASEDIKIISREEWGANESYRYINGPEWKAILKKRDIDNKKWSEKLSRMSSSKRNKIIKHSQKKSQKRKDMNNILMTTYYIDNKLVSREKYYRSHTLAWPITKTSKIKGIIIHHTSGKYPKGAAGVRKIYKSHALGRQWGDIGYNYLIGKQGEIYEGRAGGDYVVGAQTMWNNRSTVGISMIGNYSKIPINSAQYKSLKKLVRYLIKKYNIDVLKKFTFHRECLGSKCKLPLESFQLYPIIGHRDAGHTEGPGDALYAQIYKMRDEIIKEKKDYIYKKVYLVKLKILIRNKVNKMSENVSLKLLEYVEERLDREKIKQNIDILTMIKGIIKSKFNNLPLVNIINNKGNITQNIKIKLSYPINDRIVIKSSSRVYFIENKGNTLSLNGRESSVLKIDGKNSEYLEISSWNRKPIWDKTGKYNDNKFRGDLIIYVKKGKLIVVNRLPIQEYLKGLGEVSDRENPEKIKTIIIASRSYAKWYVTKAKKFKGEWYNGSDNPDEFQKYLGYGLENRSPNINRIVDETKGEVITYNNKLIKPWYSSSSSGKTKSFITYCEVKYDKNFCKQESKKYPYLLSVRDPGAKFKKGHGVGISGVGTSYLVKKGWTAEMVIKYFLSGTQISKL